MSIESDGGQRPGAASPILLTDRLDEGIGVITLNRPERRNALNSALIEALHDAVAEMADDPQVRVVVLTGAAAPGAVGGFCAGGDVKDGGRSPNGVPRDALDGDLARHDLHASMRLHLMPKPTIAMIGGPAVGAGCSLAAACDLRIASDDAVFASGFVANALSGDYGGSFLWTRIIGSARVRELYFLDERLSAERALAWGMVNYVVPAAELREHTMAIATRLARIPGAVVGRIKDNLNAAEDDADRRRLLFANEAANQAASGEDLAARLAAKRAGR